MDNQATTNAIAVRSATTVPPDAEPAGQPVESLANYDFLSLEPWFPADKAAAVLRAKRKRFALFHERNGVTFVADFRQLAAGQATRSARSYAVPLGPSVMPNASKATVEALMRLSGSAHLPVVLGGVIVGIVAREDLRADDAREAERTAERTIDRSSSAGGVLAA